MPPAADEEVVRWRGAAREFARAHLRPVAAEMDRRDRLPAGLLDDVRAAGLLGLGLPPDWGGRGGSTRAIAAVLEELAVESAAIATMVAVHISVAALPILRWGTDAQRERYLRPLADGRGLGAFALSEPAVGSDAAHLSTRYQRVDGGFRLNGSKMFITSAESASLVLTFATRDATLGHRGISGFLVPKGARGFRVAQRLDKLGIRGSETAELLFEDVPLENDALLGPEGQGLTVALSSLAGGRVGIAACALGVARAGLEELTEAVRSAPTDAGRAAVARAHVEVAAARALVDEAAREKDEGEPFVVAASAAKLFASQIAVRIASEAVDRAGPGGTRSGARPERLLRDARVFPIVEGSTEIQELILGRSLVAPGEPPAE